MTDRACKSCQATFSYVQINNRAREFCDACRKARNHAAQAAFRAKRQHNAVECGYETDNMAREIDKLAVMSHKEVAAILGITPQTSRMLERSALSKMRKFFKFDLLTQQLDNSLRS